jgi:hypothetical protein
MSYKPVKDLPRRFCPTGWGLPRLSERPRPPSEGVKSAAKLARAAARAVSDAGLRGLMPNEGKKPAPKA